jgi:predicted nucleic acid-binding protein
MNWLSMVSTGVQFLLALVTLLKNQQQIEAGEAEAIAAALEQVNERVTEAQTARQAAYDSAPNPDDPYRRD